MTHIILDTLSSLSLSFQINPSPDLVNFISKTFLLHTVLSIPTAITFIRAIINSHLPNTPSSSLVLKQCYLLPQSFCTCLRLSTPHLVNSLSSFTQLQYQSLGKPCMILPKIRSRLLVIFFHRINFLFL